MFNIGPEEIILLLVIALVFLGPNRLPEVARQVGRGLREFRSLTTRARQELLDNMMLDEEPPTTDDAPAAASPNGKAKKKGSKSKPLPAASDAQPMDEASAVPTPEPIPAVPGGTDASEAPTASVVAGDAPAAAADGSDAEPTEVSG